MKKIKAAARNKTILAIETSCDDTAIAVLECSGSLKSPKFGILENIISSQIAIHRPFGGVVPNLAKREHLKNLPLILKKLIDSGLRIKNKELRIKDKKSLIHNSKFIIPDYIAVTVGPGLEPALWTGINFAQELSKKTKIPLIGVNHMEGHLYSNLLLPAKIKFPAIALIVSGGHTILLHMKSINKWVKLGETLDDAAGEAFDKVAKMMMLPYPGGPEISKLALKGNPKAVNFPRPLLNTSVKDKNYYNFSFSGLKTSVLYHLRDNPKANKADIAASFQEAVIDVLNKKTIRATAQYEAKTIMLCGGVSANKLLRERLQETAKGLEMDFVVPDFKFSVDNAAMIAAAAYMNLLQDKKEPLEIEAQGNLSI